MPKKFEKYDSAVKQFNQNHGVNFSFERYETKRGQTGHMRSFFLSGKQKISVEDFAYRAVMTELFKESVESMMVNKVKSVDHSALVKDFDKLMDNYREYCKETGENKPSKNGGWTSGVKVVEELQEKIKNIPDDKSDFMKDKYVNRSIRLRDMRADLASMEEGGRDATLEELSRAIVYQKALEKAISGRSILWKATHWFQGPAEKRDLETIKAFIGKYEHSSMYSKAQELADAKAVGEVRTNLEAAKKDIKAKELLKPRRLKDAKQGNERMEDKTVRKHVLDQTLDIVKKSTTPDSVKEGIANGMIIGVNMGTIRLMWKEFESAQTVEEKQNVLHKRTQEVFRNSFNGAKTLAKIDMFDKMVAAQKITNLMLKQYSPATFDASYEKYTDNYILKDENFMDGFLKQNFGINEMSKEDLNKIMHEAQLSVVSGKEKLSVNDWDKYSDMIKKSEVHKDEPVLNGRTKIQ